MKKIKVMVVDDSRISRMMIRSMLAKTNFEVCAMAENAAEAIRLYEEFKPDIVTMDMNLPDTDGIECSRRIHTMDPQCRIVMISAMKDARLMMQGHLAGIRSFLQKPVSTNELLDVLMILCQENQEEGSLYRDSYIALYSKVLEESFQSMMGLSAKVEMDATADSLSVNGVAVIINIVGDPRGRLVISMSHETMMGVAKAVLGVKEDDLDEEEAQATIEEYSNIIAGRWISQINDIIRDKEMRLTPPGLIKGADVRMSSKDLIDFALRVATGAGNIYINIGFARSV